MCNNDSFICVIWLSSRSGELYTHCNTPTATYKLSNTHCIIQTAAHSLQRTHMTHSYMWHDLFVCVTRRSSRFGELSAKLGLDEFADLIQAELCQKSARSEIDCSVCCSVCAATCVLQCCIEHDETANLRDLRDEFAKPLQCVLQCVCCNVCVAVFYRTWRNSWLSKLARRIRRSVAVCELRCVCCILL